ncbi:MAG: hypothetical protein KIT89_00380 [Microcella sp.]|uniref:hypothetical protein n=1 Tax=Microcella sp. TaxID=1913979 RepID=UPI0024CA8C0B|nr:hypothetical protein [Microcella sp.]UYN83744.1 MAG: hypothetical protein KIT89_00380 [Microcella sp.]
MSTEGLTFLADGEESQADFADAAAILEIVALAAGPIPAGVAVPPYDGLDLELTSYAWAGITVTANNDGSGSSISITSSQSDRTIIVTESGIGVGSSRADAVTAGAFEEWDRDGDGVADLLGLDAVDVPGTESLVRPGTVGRQFVLLLMEGDVVVSMQVPGNDFADI